MLFVLLSVVVAMSHIVRKSLKIMCNFNINPRIALGYSFVQVILIIVVRCIFRFFFTPGVVFNIIFIFLSLVLGAIVYGGINNPNTQRPVGIGKGFIIMLVPCLFLTFIALIVTLIFLIYCPHLRSGWSFGVGPILWNFLSVKQI